MFSVRTDCLSCTVPSEIIRGTCACVYNGGDSACISDQSDTDRVGYWARCRQVDCVVSGLLSVRRAYAYVNMTT